MRRAHFNGKFNRSKSKLMLLLCQESSSWYSCRDIHLITGIPLQTARGQCCRLHRMLPVYLKRRVVSQFDTHDWTYQLHPYHFEYAIAVRGQGWLKRALPFMPVDEYVAEIEAYQAVRDGQ